MCPVLLLDVGIVVFLGGPAAGELDLAGRAVIIEMVVDEFGAVVGVQTSQPEGQAGAHVIHGGADRALALAHDGPGLYPTGIDIGEVEGLNKLAIGGVAGMRDEVDLGEARHSDIPVLGLQRDMMFEQGPRFRAPVKASADLPFSLAEVPVDRTGTNTMEMALDVRGDREVLFRPGQPERQEGLEPDGPRAARGFPDLQEDPNELRGVGGWPSTPAAAYGGVSSLGQDADRGLTMVPDGSAKLR